MSDGKLIHKGNIIELHEEPVQLREGGQTYFDILKHPGGSVIVAINDQDEICLLKQYRHAVREHIWELPAGCLEPSEPPLETAKRELEEEAGVIATEWSDLGLIYPSAGISNEVLHLFEAKNLSPGIVNLDAAEELEAHWISMETAIEMARSGEIKDAKTLAGLLRAVNRV